MEHRYLTAFYNELIIKQDYFECHEIAEEHWKSKDAFNKDDVEVFLVQVSTGEYHYRRENFTGALKCYKKARRLFKTHRYDPASIGMTDALEAFLTDREHAIIQRKPFAPPAFPLNSAMRNILRTMHDARMTDTEFTEYLRTHHITDENIIHKHLTRDRSAVNQARARAIEARIKRSHHP